MGEKIIDKAKGEEKKEMPKHGKIIRILQTDIPGEMQIYPGLTKIKGISWTFSNAICNKLGIDKKIKIQDLSKEEIKKIGDFSKEVVLPEFLLNRRKDFDSGENSHLIGSDLDLKKEFDIKRLKKIKSYRGYRHLSGLPVRGQRTRSHFRRNKAKGAGIKKKVKK